MSEMFQDICTHQDGSRPKYDILAAYLNLGETSREWNEASYQYITKHSDPTTTSPYGSATGPRFQSRGGFNPSGGSHSALSSVKAHPSTPSPSSSRMALWSGIVPR